MISQQTKDTVGDTTFTNCINYTDDQLFRFLISCNIWVDHTEYIEGFNIHMTNTS